MRAGQRVAQSNVRESDLGKDSGDTATPRDDSLRLDLSDLDFGLKEGRSTESQGYTATIHGTPESEIKLFESLQATSERLEKVARIINESAILPKPETPKFPWDKVQFNAFEAATSEGKGTMRFFSYPLTAIGIGVALSASAGVGVAITTIGFGMFAASQEKNSPVWSWIGERFSNGWKALKRCLDKEKESVEASSIISKLQSEIKNKGFTAAEEKEFLGGVVTTLKDRSSAYAKLAEEVKRTYASAKDTRFEIMRDKLLELSDFAEKASVAKKHPKSVTIDINLASSDPKVCEELVQFISKQFDKAVLISRPSVPTLDPKRDLH